MSEEFEFVLRRHAERYPKMQPQDAVKLCYQAEFGGGHIVMDVAENYRQLEAECEGLSMADGEPLFEDIGEGLSRLHLRSLGEEFPTLHTVHGAFLHSTFVRQGTMEGLEQKLELLKALCAAGGLPFSVEALGKYLDGYRAEGCPMVSHSGIYRATYEPAYRVMLGEFERLWPLLQMIDRAMEEKEPVLVAIEGHCGAGKTTLGKLLQDVYGANLYHMDDFFLPPEMRTRERLSEPGGNVHYERFKAEVLDRLLEGEDFSYRPYDCQSGELGKPVHVKPTWVEIIEGAYSLHKTFGDVYDVEVFCDIDPKAQSERILKRNGEFMHRRFMNEWIPMENRYFEAFQVKDRCGFVLGARE